MAGFDNLRELSEAQSFLIQEYVRIAHEANTEAHELLRLIDSGDMPEIHRHLKAKPLLNPYSLHALARMIEKRAHKRSGTKGADLVHGKRNRPAKQAALDWFKEVRGTINKDDAADEIARNFHRSWRTARDWLKGV